MDRPVEIAVVGAGNRGGKYLGVLASMPGRARVAAIVEPDPRRRRRAAATAPGALLFDSLEEMLAAGVRPDAAVIATSERRHYPQAMALLDAGAHLLIEKPLGVSVSECAAIRDKAADLGLVAGVCHVLRYHPYFIKLHELALSGIIGETVSITHRVDVGVDRSCHTFVRGPWGDTGATSPIVLSKLCHDLDLLVWLTGAQARKLECFGGRRFFTSAKAPAGSAARCVDCAVEKGCPYSAVDLYRRRRQWCDSFPGSEEIERELAAGQYGRCVFSCSNDAADRLALALDFDSGAVATVTMNLFTRTDGRDTYISGTRGEIHGNGTVITCDSADGSQTFDFSGLDPALHCGADAAVIADFLDAITAEGHTMRSTAADSMESHRIALAAADRYIVRDRTPRP